MKFKDLELNKMYLLEDETNQWIAKVIYETRDGKKEFDDIVVIYGVDAEFGYRFSESNFDNNVSILKEVSLENDPEYFI